LRGLYTIKKKIDIYNLSKSEIMGAYYNTGIIYGVINIDIMTDLSKLSVT
jgi:hypothetical protein